MTIVTDIQNSSRNYQTVTITIASPSVFTCPFHGLQIDDRILLATTGALPTGFAEETYYYVISTGLDVDTFELSATKGGTAINGTGSQSGTQYAAAHKNARMTVSDNNR